MFRSFPKGNRKFHKKIKNIQKIEKYHNGFIPNPNRKEKAEKERKYKLSFYFVPSRKEIENSKKIGKIFKNLKHTIMASFQAKICRERQRKSENKNYRYVSFLPAGEEKISKK